MRRTFILLLFVFSLVFGAPRAYACSCMATPTVLNSFESSNLVVATRLVSVEKTREKQGEYDIGYIRSATMVVTKVYKGNVKPGQELKFAQGGGADCVWTFDESWIGDEFLFYLGPPTKGHPWIGSDDLDEEVMYHAMACGRSKGLDRAFDDLGYLDHMDKLRGRTRLSGTFGVWSDGDFKRENIKLKIVGKTNSFSTKSDKNGFFEIYDLPPDDYVAVVDPPFGWKIDDYMLGYSSTGYENYDPRRRPTAKNQIPIRIQKGKHTALDLIFRVDTAIKGKVVSPTGKPMKGACVTAVSTELKEGDYRGGSNCTNDNGEFVVDDMRPGNYILVVNTDGRLDGDEPFVTTFYPGVSEYRNAGIVKVEAGRYNTGRIIQIPQTVELVIVRGKFLFADGKPVIDEQVKFVPVDSKRFDDMSKKTDDSGSFVFLVPKGAVGSISGEMYTYRTKFKNCSTIEAVIKENGGESFTAQSSIVHVDSNEPPEMIEITLPFPSCEKAKKDQ